MADLKELPLFPLNMVLFPGMMLPLHIFEPRYRLMITECVEQNKPFGIVLIREGVEVGGDAVPYEIGTSAHITAINKLSDGRMNINTVGYRRFKLHGIQRNKPYLIGITEDYPFDDQETPDSMRIAKQLADDLHRYLQRFAELSDSRVSIDKIPENSLGIAFLTAIALPLPPEEKQTLLEATNLASLLQAEKTLMRREWMLLDHMSTVLDEQEQRADDNNSTLFSMN